jgi:hypothetical protein
MNHRTLRCSAPHFYPDNIGVTEQSTHGPVFIGKAPWDGRAFNDLIDEVAIFNVVLGSLLAVSQSGKLATAWGSIKQE